MESKTCSETTPLMADAIDNRNGIQCDEVRVVQMGGATDIAGRGAWSVELCGGTHVNRTGDISLLKIISESAVAGGVRRIEAVTESGALDWLDTREAALQQAAVAPQEARAAVQQAASAHATALAALQQAAAAQQEAQAGPAPWLYLQAGPLPCACAAWWLALSFHQFYARRQ